MVSVCSVLERSSVMCTQRNLKLPSLFHLSIPNVDGEVSIPDVLFSFAVIKTEVLVLAGLVSVFTYSL